MSESGFSLFGGLDAASISDDPFAIPDDAYFAACTNAEVKETKGGEGKQKKLGLNLTWKIMGGPQNGSEVREWYQVGPILSAEGTDEYVREVRQRGFLKKRLLAMGIPESRMASFQPSDCVGVTGMIKTKKRDAGVIVQDFTFKSQDDRSEVPGSTGSNIFG